MNYIQLNTSSKAIGLKLNQLALQTFWKELENTDNNNILIGSMYAAVYAAYIGNCYAKRVEPDLTFENICDIVDELSVSEEGRKQLEQVDKMYIESELYKQHLAKISDAIRLLANEQEEPAEKKN